jgi:hypothetical protein
MKHKIGAAHSEDKDLKAPVLLSDKPTCFWKAQTLSDTRPLPPELAFLEMRLQNHSIGHKIFLDLDAQRIMDLLCVPSGTLHAEF